MEKVIRINGIVNCEVYDSDGELKDKTQLKNIVVDTMLNSIIESFIAQTSNPCSGFSNIALGSGDTPETISDTGLDSEFAVGDFGVDGGNVYATRIAGFTAVNYVTNTYTVTGEITNKHASTLSINETGLFNAATPQVTGAAIEMGSRTTFAQTISLATDETLRVTWTWTVSSA
jgi:hypothetical protein